LVLVFGGSEKTRRRGRGGDGDGFAGRRTACEDASRGEAAAAAGETALYHRQVSTSPLKLCNSIIVLAISKSP
jgi:hypothetical protein